ncbi:NAD-dependent epimerase/dehydratase family protein [Thermoleophilum album]|uniref:UDP-glucose 4-epimerase n=1 Tax=Thermoleophilum album TaxID=29539 RepID=A0A1H6FPS4_THEAL|nr:NAD-dependent epimerase/dehydratase family protein [Thermoleophilum album]SEH11754.1 UDP-glucose 4-epimerase [Thermoleophilum album]
MRAVVTGGAGFIGSNLVDALLEEGHEVVAIDNLSTGRRSNLAGALARGARLVELDICDRQALLEAFEEARPEVVFHLAAQIDVRKSTADPAYDARVNVEGTINVLEAARATGARRVVNSSTGGAIYGEGQILPAPENHPVAPEAPYGQSKFAAEGYCELFRRLHGLSTISLRYGNVYGPRQDPLGEAGVIAIFCGRLVAGERPTVYGDGHQTRDYVYVGDVVEANLLAANCEATGAFNIGTGVETSVLELIKALAPHAHAPFEPEYAPPRLGEVRHIALDSSRAARELGWQARTTLAEGLEKTLSAVKAAA